MIHGHGGNIWALADELGCRPDEIIDMSSNINPLGMMPGMLDHLRENLDQAGRLPQVDGQATIAGMAGLLATDPGSMLAGNGTTQFIYTACPALGAQTALIVGPTYADYGDACRMHAIEPQYFLLESSTSFEADLRQLHETISGFDMVFICNPNNPTGGLMTSEQLFSLCRKHPRTYFIIDESYLPFAAAGQNSMTAARLENLVVLWSASKIFGMPGLRAGFLIGAREVVARFAHFAQPWCVNSLAQAAIAYLGCRKKAVHDFIHRTAEYLTIERDLFTTRLQDLDALSVYPSVTSYLLIQLPAGIKAQALCKMLAQERLLIRNCSNFHGLDDQFVRVALKSPEENQMAADRLVSAVNRLGPG